jgi:predicted Zn-dependent protease
MRYRVFHQVAVWGVLSLLVCPSLWAAECGPSRYDCAVFYLSHHDASAAIHALNEELQQSPRNLKALNLLGIVLTESGDVEAAGSKFKEALAVDPDFYPARKNLAINEFNLHRLREARTEFNRVLKNAPADPVVHIYLAEISYLKDDCGAALLHYERAASRVAANRVWTLHYAECLTNKGEVARATAVLEKLPAGDGEANFQGGLILGRSGAHQASAALFAVARMNYRDPYLAGYNQLLMLIRAGTYPEAIQVFNQLVGEGYGKAELYNLISEAYLKKGDVKEAYDSLRTATKLEPTAEENYVDLAAICMDDESYDLGLEILDVGIHYVPNSYRLYVQRGFMLVMRGRMEDAEKQFQLASKLAPEKPLPYIALGEVWMQMGQAQKAADMLREKSRAPEANFLIPYIFAEALIRSGADPGTPSAAEAMDALERSIRLNSKYAHSHAELGKLLLKQGELERAIPELKTATELDPDDSGSFYQLGQAYRKKGEKAKADEMLARVAQLHTPEHELDEKKELRRLVKQDTSAPQMEAKP